jgi:hypothetical protein
MGQSYQLNKVHIYNYRNKEGSNYNAYMKIYQIKMRAWKKVQKEFFNILYHE